VVFRLDLPVIVASVAGVLLWIEHGHRIDIATPLAGAFAASASAVCPDHENVPYGADCIVFMQGERAPDVRRQANIVAVTPAALSGAPGPACPSNNENAPYSADCLRFMSGWFWQPNK